MRLIRLLSVAAVAVLLTAPAARAQGHANVFVGSNFSGDAGRSLSTALNDGSRLTWGGAIGGTFNGIFGAEVDMAYARQFFGDNDILGDNYVFTLVPSIIVGVPVGGESGQGSGPMAPQGSDGSGATSQSAESGPSRTTTLATASASAWTDSPRITSASEQTIAFSGR